MGQKTSYPPRGALPPWEEEFIRKAGQAATIIISKQSVSNAQLLERLTNDMLYFQVGRVTLQYSQWAGITKDIYILDIVHNVPKIDFLEQPTPIKAHPAKHLLLIVKYRPYCKNMLFLSGSMNWENIYFPFSLESRKTDLFE